MVAWLLPVAIVAIATHTLFSHVQDWAAGPVRLQLPDLASIQPVAVAIAVVAAILLI